MTFVSPNVSIEFRVAFLCEVKFGGAKSIFGNMYDLL